MPLLLLQWIQDQFLRDADGSPSKFEQCCYGKSAARARDANESLLDTGSVLLSSDGKGNLYSGRGTYGAE